MSATLCFSSTGRVYSIMNNITPMASPNNIVLNILSSDGGWYVIIVFCMIDGDKDLYSI